MKILDRIGRHARMTWTGYRPDTDLPILILFINSVCNMRCDHCFYWRNLNKKDDLTMEEIIGLSRALGHIENLNLSGGEPFLRPELAEVCKQFIRCNGVRQIYVPTNGYFTKETVKQVAETLKEQELDLFAIELSLDGMPEFHDKLRGTPGSFEKAMKTYDALEELQERDPRLRIHAVSTATHLNLDEIKYLSTFLFERCPKMDHHNLALIRGDHKNSSLFLPDLEQYQNLYEYIRRLWAPREKGRYGAVVEPMLQWAKLRTLEKKTQVIPCPAGKLNAVVYANGDVSFCELQRPLGNLRRKSFWDIWNSEEAKRLQEAIERKECYCTTEMFLWPGIVYRPIRLVQAMISAKIWRKPKPLKPEEKVSLPVA